MTEWDIGSGWECPDFAVGQHYEVAKCALSQVGANSDMTLDVARM